MTSEQIIDRYKKSLRRSTQIAETEFQTNIINYAKDKCISILMLDGREHCDAGYLVKQYKRIFK